MIEGVKLLDLIIREDERGYLTEIGSEGWPDMAAMPHVYEAMARDGVIKAFHAHMQQTDRFYCLEGVAKVGLIDLRGPVYEHTAGFPYPDSPEHWLCHVGGDSDNTEFAEVYPDDKAWTDALGIVGQTKTFGDHETVILSRKRAQLLFIPPGVAHGQMGVRGRSRLLNLPTVAYNRAKPDEVRMQYNLLGFPWEIGNR